MKYILEPVSKNQIIEFLGCRKKTDILIGTDFLTCGDSYKMSLDELNDILNLQKNIKVSLKINRLFHEKELEQLINYLKQIDFNKIKFVFYSDLCLIDIFSMLNINDKLVYDAYTYTTNYLDVLEYSKYNKYVVVSNQISTSEIASLTNKTNNVIIYGFGKSVIFYSKRPLLSNYFKYRNLNYDANDRNYNLKEEFREDLYHIYEDEHGSYVYEPKYYYLFDELKDLNNVDYLILNSTSLNAKQYKQVVNAYLNNNFEKLLEINIPLYKGIMETKSVLLKSEVE